MSTTAGKPRKAAKPKAYRPLIRTTIGAKELHRIVAAASRVARKKAPARVLGAVLLTVDGGTVSAECTDLDVRITAWGEAVTARSLGGKVLVDDAAGFRTVLKSLDGPVVLTTLPLEGGDKQAHELQIECGDLALAWGLLDVDDFPADPFGWDAKVLAKVLANGSVDADAVRSVEGALKTRSKDESRPVLTGVRLGVKRSGKARADGSKAGTLSSAATDSYRLHLNEHPARVIGDPLGPVVIQGSGLDELLRLLGRSPRRVAWVETDASLYFLIDTDYRVSVRKVDGQFPNVEQLIPSGQSFVATFQAGGVEARLRQLLASNESLKRGTPVRWTIRRDGSMEASCGFGGRTTKVKLPAAKVKMPARVKVREAVKKTAMTPAQPAAYVELGDGIELGFNTLFLIDALQRFDGEVRLHMIQPLRPVVFDQADSTSRHLLMPIRLAG